MAFFADLHIHSKHSRATSRDCDLEHLAWWAGRKGIGVVGTGDFAHPAWFTEIREKLVPEGDTGLFRLRDDLERDRLRALPATCRAPVHFMLSVEISTVYKKDDRTRKIHHLVYAPDFETAERFNATLGRIGDLSSDGRPLLGLDSRHLLEVTLESGPGAYLVPAHVWTPRCSVLGALSGFDHVDQCYGDLASHVFAIETGVSSDPPMNWRVSELDRYRLVSNSDAHSPPMVGREASVFECEPEYFAMRHALETGRHYGGTVEFFPEEGKYHLDGHRKCGVRLEPSETRAREGTCPACRKPVTEGVMHRVDALSDRSEGERPDTAAPFRSLVPLPEIVGEIAGVGPRSKTVTHRVSGLVERLGPELHILNDVPEEDLKREGSELVREAISRLRRGEVRREAGYDGKSGVIRLFRPSEIEQCMVVAPLFDLGHDDEDAAVDTTPKPSAPPPPPAVNARAEKPRRRKSKRARNLLEELDPDQRAAAETHDGPLLVVAGPGTGKTRTCTHRIAHLVESGLAKPAECIAISFSRKSARDMRERLDALLPRRARGIDVTTFHGLGLRILTEQRTKIGLHRGFRVADEDERLVVMRDQFGLSVPRARRLLQEISHTKRTRTATTAGADTGPRTEALLLLEHYQEALNDRHIVDFDDLILLPVQLLESDRAVRDAYRERLRWMSVDEYQDVDPLQYRLIRSLAAEDANLCVTGDPDQAIYGFRGADAGFFLRFERDYHAARRIELSRNYRSTSTIVDAATQAIAPGTQTGSRRVTATSKDEAPPRIVIHAARTARSEAGFVTHTIERLLGRDADHSIDPTRFDPGAPASRPSFSDCAVLFRTAPQGDTLEAAFHRAGIPFQRRNHKRLLDLPAVRAIVDRLRQHDEPQEGADAPALPFGGHVRSRIDLVAREAAVAHELRLRASPRTATEDDETSAADIRTAADLLQPLAEPFGTDVDGFLSELALGAAEIDSLDRRANRVSLLTLHAAKGLEFPVVFLVGCEDGLHPFRQGDDPPGDGEEERRLFFVGMTRAERHLYLSWARQRRTQGRIGPRRPSPYLEEIDAGLLEHRRPEVSRQTKAATTKQLALL